MIQAHYSMQTIRNKTCIVCNKTSSETMLMMEASGCTNFYCKKHAREKIDTTIAALKFQIGELQRLREDSFPIAKKDKPDADFNVGEHL